MLTGACNPGFPFPFCDLIGVPVFRLQAEIKTFVANGGGFVGICAGAFVGSSWGLGMLDVELPWVDEWAR